MAQALNFTDGSFSGNITTVNATCLECMKGNASNVVTCANTPTGDSCSPGETVKTFWSFKWPCYSDSFDCDDFLGNLTELTPSCQYCESFYLLDDPGLVWMDDANTLCAGPAANETCPDDVGEVFWYDYFALEGEDRYLADQAATNEACAYCLFMNFGTEECFEIPSFQKHTCSNALGLQPAHDCWDYWGDNPNGGVDCPNALENLTESCGNCVGNENVATYYFQDLVER